MKSLKELYQEIAKSDDLKKQFAEAAKNGTIIDFAKANDVETTLDEIEAFFEEKAYAEGELSDEEAVNAAGGCNNPPSEAETSYFDTGGQLMYRCNIS